MNSTSRTASRGGTKSKDKGHKSDSKKDSGRPGDFAKGQTSDRVGHNSTNEESVIREKISQIKKILPNLEDDEIITALHDCDNDTNKAINMLMEEEGRGQWETSGKKKRNRQASTSKGAEGAAARGDVEGAEDGDSQPLGANMDRERSRGRGGGANRSRRRGGAEGRGPGRGRDNNKENEGGGDDGFRGGFRRGGRGMSNGPGSRGGRGGRGGSRLGSSRTFQSRDRSAGDRFPSTIDTWNPPGAQESGDNGLKMDTWGGGADEFPPAEDWDNEEYTGSLVESKVFTPSALEANVQVSEQILEASQNQDILSMSANSAQEFHQSSAMPASPLPVGMGTLNSAQAQYLNQLTQQSAAENLKVRSGSTAATANAYQTESLKTAVGIGASGGYSQPNSYSQTDTYDQSSYTQASYGQSTASGYGGPSNSFQAPSGFATSGATSYAGTTQNYQTTGNSSFGVYPPTGANSYSTQSYTSSGVTYDNTSVQSEVSVTQSAQVPRAKPQRVRVPPPSKIPSSAVEMPEDAISAGVSSLDVQFGGLEFGSDSTSFEPVSADTNKFQQQATPPSIPATTDVTPPTASLDNTTSQSSTLDPYTGAQNAAAVKTSQQASLVSGLSGKGLSSGDGLTIQSSTDHKNNYNSQSTRTATSSSSGLDLGSKSDVSGSLSYPSAPTAATYGSYQSQKSSSNVYQTTNYASNTAYTVSQTTYSTPTYSTQPAVNSSYPNSSYSSNSTPANYAVTGGVYPTANSYQNASQSYQSGGASVYGSSLGSGYSSTAASGYQNSYSTNSSTSGKLNSGLVKDSQEYSAGSTTSSIASTTNAALTTTPQTITTTSAKVTTGQIKSSVVPNMHPQLMGAPQYIVGQTGVPAAFYQAPVYGFDDVLMQQRIHHMPGYYDMTGYSAPTSLAGVTGRDSLGSVAYTMADARYSTRGDNNASPVPSTLSQQTASAAHQQPMMNHPSFPPGYTYVYGTMPGSFHQYGTPIYPVPSAGNAHGTSSSQYGKPASYASTYGSGYEGLNQTADYTKSAYVSAGGSAAKSGVGAVAVSSATTASDLYGKQHTALGKVNSYDKQGFHSATPPPFNLPGGQSTGMAPGGAYAPQLFIPAPMAPHQQHHGTALITSHLQDSGSSGQRSQSAAQPSKAGNKQNYNNYWPPN